MSAEGPDAAEGAEGERLEKGPSTLLWDRLETPTPPPLVEVATGVGDVVAKAPDPEQPVSTTSEPSQEQAPNSPAPETGPGAGAVAGRKGHPVTGHAVLARGSNFGVYVVDTCIGEGGMARVYRAEHAGLRRQVALKVLMYEFANDPEGRERFVREARIAAAIKHPNVVNIFDVGVHDDIPYLVMELLEGTDLEAMLATRGALDEGLILDIMVPVIAGLIAVHDAGIVHRDLKPGNIFLSTGRYDDVEPKLLDFGISKAHDPDQMRITNRDRLMGTPYYLCPEGLNGGDFSPLSDQYSLGVVMYECAVGRPPYKDVSLHELVQMISRGDHKAPDEYNPRISKRLTRIIMRAMSLDPALRYPDLRAMGRELLSLAGQRTRITWGLSFENVRAKSVTPVQSPAPVVAPPASKPKRSLLARSLPFALVVLGAMVPILAFGPWRPGAHKSSPVVSSRPAEVASEAAAPQPVTRLAIKTRPGEAEPSPTGSPSLQRSGAPGHDPPGGARLTVASERPSQPSKRAARTVSSSGRGVSRRAASSPPLPVPEWAPPTFNSLGAQNRVRDTKSASNSNGAPIFD